MRTHGSLLLFVALLPGLARAQGFPSEETLPGCGHTCLDTAVSKASTFGCNDGSASCLCGVGGFQDSVHGCSEDVCAPDLIPLVTNYLVSVCATAVAAPATSATPAATTPSALPTPPTSPASASTSPAVQASTPNPSTTTSATLSTSPSPSTTWSSVATSSAIPTSSTSSSTLVVQSPTSTTALVIATQSTASASSSTSASSSATAAASAGLSGGAKAGIGIGAAAGAVALIAALVACVVAHKHKKRDGQLPIQISEPMAGSGRLYAADTGHNEMADLEMKSRRYEDMLPRHVPRNMV